MFKHPRLPERIDFIWFGGVPKSARLDSIKETKVNNPNYSVKLWISNQLVSPTELGELKCFCLENNIELIDFDDPNNSAELFNIDLIKDFLSQGKDTTKKNQAIRHWLAASDLLRVALMYQYGGHYFDAKIVATNLDKIVAPKGFLLPLGENVKLPLHSMNFHLLASQPGRKIFLRLAKSQRLRFITAFTKPEGNDYFYKLNVWKRDLSIGEQHYATVLLTGSFHDEAYSELKNFDNNNPDDVEAVRFPENDHITLKKEMTRIEFPTARDVSTAAQNFAGKCTLLNEEQKKYLTDDSDRNVNKLEVLCIQQESTDTSKLSPPNVRSL